MNKSKLFSMSVLALTLALSSLLSYSLAAESSSESIPNQVLVPNQKQVVNAPSLKPSQYVLKKITDVTSLENTTPVPYGITSLSDKDLNDYKEKHKVRVDVPVLNQLIDESPDQYSGMYFNPDKGTIVVQITNDSKELKDKTIKNMNIKLAPLN